MPSRRTLGRVGTAVLLCAALVITPGGPHPVTRAGESVELRIRVAGQARHDRVGEVALAAQEAGIQRVGFVQARLVPAVQSPGASAPAWQP